MKTPQKNNKETKRQKVVRTICLILALLMLGSVAYYAFLGIQLLFAA